MRHMDFTANWVSFGEKFPLRRFCPLETFTSIISGTPGCYSFESELQVPRHRLIAVSGIFVHDHPWFA